MARSAFVCRLLGYPAHGVILHQIVKKKRNMSSINANATVTLTVNGKQAQDMLDGLKKKSQDLEKAIQQAAQSGNKASLNKLQRELKQTNKQISQIESATVGVEKVLHNLDRATPKELNRTLSTLKKQLNGIERGTAEWNRQCEAIRRVKAEIEQVNSSMQVAEGRWSRFNRVINDWQTTIMGAAAAATGLVMAGRSAVNAFAEMEAEEANVRKFTGMTKEQVTQLNEEFKKMDTRTSREDLNKLAQEAGRLGKSSVEDVMGFVKAADQINVALDDLGEGATLTLSKLTNIFGDEARLGTEKSLLAVGSVINELSQNCTASAPYLAQFAQRLAGVGAQAKMTIPEIMGFGAVLDSQGQAVEMSATALSVLITDLFKNQDQIIKATGMNAEKFKETLKRSTNEGLLMLIQRLHELGNIDVLAPVFKEMGENGSRAAGVLAALAGNIDMIKWEQQEANKAFNEATSVTAEFNVQNNTVQAGLEKATKKVRDVAVELGEKLAPVMSHVISSSTLLLKAMSAVVTFIGRFGAELVAATAVMAAYAVAVNLVTIKTKVATAAHVLWNAAVKTTNVLIPIAQVLLNGLRLAYERIIWQTRGATAAQQAYSKALVALKANAAAAKTAYGLLAVAIAAVAVALVRYIKSQQTEAIIQKNLNTLKNEAIKKTEEERWKVLSLVEAAKNENLAMEKRRKAVNELNKIIPEYNAQIDKTTGKYKASKEALDKYINSLIRQAEVEGARDHIRKLSNEISEINADNLKQQELKEKAEREAKRGGAGYGSSSITGASTAGTGMFATSGAWIKANNKIGENNRKIKERQKEIGYFKKLYGEDMAIADIKSTENNNNNGGSGIVPTSTTTGTGSGSGDTQKDKLEKEKQWREKEEALNRIAYATGKRNYEDYTNRMTEIAAEYHQKVMSRTDLTEKERLDAEAGYYEERKKLAENQNKQSVEQEERYYQQLVAHEKQRYIDGEVDKDTYQQTVELLELQHLKRLVELQKEGTSERLQAERAYQDRLLADQEKHRQETEKKEAEHQKRLAELKKEYFGDNPEERQKKYMEELEMVKLIYQQEMGNAGDNEGEKKRIEEAMEKAKDLLKSKYNIDDEDKNWLEKAEDDINKWIEGPGKKWIEAFNVISQSMSAIFSQLTSVIQAETEIQTQAVEKRYDEEIAKAEGNNYRIKQLEKKKQEEVAKIKNQANKKMYTMQVMEAIAQTATAAINAYSSAAAIKGIGYIIAPIAAAAAVAAGMVQVAAIRKQQKASEAQGYSEGGFTGKGKKDEVAGVVHKGEWVASQQLVNSPVTRPMIDALEYAQRTNTIGSLSPVGQAAPAVIVQQSPANTELAAAIKSLNARLNEPFVTVNQVAGDHGIKQAEDEYEKLIRNKTPKSRRK